MLISALLVIAILFWLLLVAKVDWRVRAMCLILLLTAFVGVLCMISIENDSYIEIMRTTTTK